MADKPEDFLANLSVSRLISDEAARTFVDSIPEDKKPQTAEQLGLLFVQYKKLTRYQASRVLHNKTAALVLGEYFILDKIGSGGMGMVFLARHRKMKRSVAIKVLPPGLSRNPIKLQRFQREMQAAALLNHPNIVTSHDAGEDNGTHYLVMEYIDGSDLGRIVTEKGPLSLSKTLDYTLQAARGLQYAHQSGIIHRDIKPQNLLLDKTGVVKILDMGLARFDNPLAEDDPGVLTQTGSIMGTADFMSPEQALNTKYADHRADIYSLGCTLYYLLCGEPVFAGESMMEKLLAHREIEPPSLLNLDSNITVGLDAIFARMLEKKPERRFQSMAEVIDALEQQLHEVTLGCSVQSGIGSRWIQPSYEEEFEEDDPAPWENLKPSEEDPVPREPARAANRGTVIPTGGTVIPDEEHVSTRRFSSEDDSPDATDAFILPETPRRISASAPLPQGPQLSTAWAVGSYALLTVALLVAGAYLLWNPSQTADDAANAQPPKGSLATAGQSPDKDGPAPSEFEPPAKPVTARELAQRQQVTAKELDVPAEIVDSLGIELELIPPGDFRMGAPSTERANAHKQATSESERKSIDEEGPVRFVSIERPFYLSAYEITVGQYRQFVEATGYKTDAEKPGHVAKVWKEGDWVAAPNANWRTAAADQSDDHPVSLLSWGDAAAFCLWLSEKEGRRYRLPTSAEWEYAARAGTVGAYAITSAGTSPDFEFSAPPEAALTREAWFATNAEQSTHPVGLKSANPFGLHDMFGNVAEWCSDAFPTLQHRESISDSAANYHDNRQLRGGSFASQTRELRSASFRYMHPELPVSYAGIGFRVAMDLPQDRTPLSPLAIDLMATIDPVRDAVAGKFRETSLGLLIAEDYFSRLAIPLDVLPLEYQLDFAVRRVSGQGSFYVGLVSGGKQFAVNLDAWSGSVSGLESLGGRDASSNESTRRTRLFTDGKTSQLSIVVRGTGIRVVCDGRTIINWSGDVSRLSLPSHLSIGDPKRLFVGSHRSSYEIEQMTIKPLGTEPLPEPMKRAAERLVAGRPRPKPDAGAERPLLKRMARLRGELANASTDSPDSSMPQGGPPRRPANASMANNNSAPGGRNPSVPPDGKMAPSPESPGNPSANYKRTESQFLAAMAIGDTQGAQTILDAAQSLANESKYNAVDRKRLKEDQEDLDSMKKFEETLEAALTHLKPGEKLRLRSQGGHEFVSYDAEQREIHTTQFGLKRVTKVGDLTIAELETMVERERPRESVETKRILAVFHAFHRLGYPPTAVVLLRQLGLDEAMIRRRYSERTSS